VLGAFGGVVSHYVCWYIHFVFAYLGYEMFGFYESSLGEGPANPVQALLGAFAFSMFSLLIFGWVTVSAGAWVGYFSVHRWKKMHGDENDSQEMGDSQ